MFELVVMTPLLAVHIYYWNIPVRKGYSPLPHINPSAAEHAAQAPSAYRADTPASP